MLESLTALIAFVAVANATLKSTTGIGLDDVVANTLGNLTTEGLQRLFQRDDPQTQLINGDVQRAFRAAIYAALHDVGGQACFPAAWTRDRAVPPDAVYPWQRHRVDPHDWRLIWLPGARNDPERHDCAALWAIGRAVQDETLFPISPPTDHLAASAYTYLRLAAPDQPAPSANPAPGPHDPTLTTADLARLFVEEILAHLPPTPHATVSAALRDPLEAHLLNRTLFQLHELLKSPTYTRAWRGFTRLMLAGLRDGIQQQQQSLQRIEQALESPSPPPPPPLPPTWIASWPT